MTTVTVYDPPMCCATGVCGPEIDPRLAQFAGDLEWLKARSVKVERVNLAQESERFAKNDAIREILERSGTDELPAIVIDDTIVASGKYPSRDELAAFTGLSKSTPLPEVNEQVRELIALGAAIGASCEPCFKFHYDKGRKLGLSVEAMREAVQIGAAVQAASTGNLLALSNRMLGTAAPKASTDACCGAPAENLEKASNCC